MTATDKPRFAEAFTRLALALREKHPGAPTKHVYFEGLQMFEIEIVCAAAERLQRAPWFPKLGEWARAAPPSNANAVKRNKHSCGNSRRRSVSHAMTPDGSASIAACAAASARNSVGWNCSGVDPGRCSRTDRRHRRWEDAMTNRDRVLDDECPTCDSATP